MTIKDKRREILNILAYECYAAGENKGEPTGRDDRAVDRAIDELNELDLNRDELFGILMTIYLVEINVVPKYVDAIIKARESKRSGNHD